MPIFIPIGPLSGGSYGTGGHGGGGDGGSDNRSGGSPSAADVYGSAAGDIYGTGAEVAAEASEPRDRRSTVFQGEGVRSEEPLLTGTADEKVDRTETSWRGSWGSSSDDGGTDYDGGDAGGDD